MRVLIIDERKGQEITPEILDHVNDADILFVIAMDGKVSADVKCSADTEVVVDQASYIELPHRDQLSGEESAKMYDVIEQRRTQAEIDNPPPSPLAAMAHAYEGPSNSGTEKITQS